MRPKGATPSGDDGGTRPGDSETAAGSIEDSLADIGNPRTFLPKGFRVIEPTQFGRYTVLARLGRGGMADVFLAIATGPAGFRKLTVLKRLRKTLDDNPDFVQMFLDEARLAARLNHANVVQTYEVATVDEHCFLAMEYLEGLTLEQVRDRLLQDSGELPVDLLGHIVSEVLEGLAHAHELTDFDGTPLHVIHRDLTPANVMLTYDGVVKLVDFGVAKARTQMNDTDPNFRKGKYAYMAPEMIEGRADQRADLFGLGVVFWEALAGRRLFLATDPVATLSNVLHAEIPDLGLDRGSLASKLEKVARRALARDLDERYESARSMRNDLDRVLRSANGVRRRSDLASFMQGRFGAVRKAQARAIRGCVEAGLESGTAGFEVVSALGDSARPGALSTPPRSGAPSGAGGAARAVSSTPLPSDIASASRAASDSISRTKEESFEGFAAAGRGSRVLAFLSDPKRAWPAYAAAGVTLVLVLVLAVDLQSAARPSSSFAVAESRTPPHVAGPRPFGARVEAETDDAVAATTIETGPDEAAESPDQAGSPDELEDLALEDPFAAALPEPAARDLEAFVHWREEGRRLFSEGRYPDAMEAYARATELNPAHAGSFAGLAASALEAGEIERGVVAYQEAVRLAPTQSGYHAALGRAYRDAGRIDLAVESYRQALRLNRRNSAARAALRELGFRVRPRRR